MPSTSNVDAVFKSAPIITLKNNQPVKNNQQTIALSIGGSEPLNALLINTAVIEQPYRTQFDVSVDGSEYIVAAGKGIGTYTFTVLEGPFECANMQEYDTVLEHIKDFKGSLKNRRVLMTLKNGARTSLTYSGVLVNVHTQINVDDDGQKTIVSTIQTTGAWQ